MHACDLSRSTVEKFGKLFPFPENIFLLLLAMLKTQSRIFLTRFLHVSIAENRPGENRALACGEFHAPSIHLSPDFPRYSSRRITLSGVKRGSTVISHVFSPSTKFYLGAWFSSNLFEGGQREPYFRLHPQSNFYPLIFGRI